MSRVCGTSAVPEGNKVGDLSAPFGPLKIQGMGAGDLFHCRERFLPLLTVNSQQNAFSPFFLINKTIPRGLFQPDLSRRIYMKFFLPMNPTEDPGVKGTTAG